jgi:hypothetical protein
VAYSFHAGMARFRPDSTNELYGCISGPGIPGVSPDWRFCAFNFRYQLLKGRVKPGCHRASDHAPASLRRFPFGARIRRHRPANQLSSKLGHEQAPGYSLEHWRGRWCARAKNPLGDRAAASGYNLGQSFVWLVRPRFNALLETTWNQIAGVVSRNRVESFHDLLLSPRCTLGLQLPSGLQIVPGIAIPVGLGPSAGEKGVFVYLSLEHHSVNLGDKFWLAEPAGHRPKA